MVQSSLSATIPDLSITASSTANVLGAGTPVIGVVTPVLIVTVTTPTVVYLSGFGQFTSGTVNAAGIITAIPIGTSA